MKTRDESLFKKLKLKKMKKNKKILIKRKNTYSATTKKKSEKNTSINTIRKTKKIHIDNDNVVSKNDIKILNQTLQQNEGDKSNKTASSSENKKKTRSPIITIAGHIDHGKTTLLNYIRQTKITPKEHGDITQYIKPYYVKTKHGFMTFLDTPGHYAFNSIRKKSIKYTDIMILIIAIDDGIKPQTIESIEIAKSFNIPIIVAVNKIDKSDNKNEKIINELSKYDLIPEKWGGDTLTAFISAKTGQGIEDLIDLINLQAEMLDLKANYTGPAEGIILDNKIDMGKGQITTIITLNGLLKRGDLIMTKGKHGKIKTITDDSGNIVTAGYPSHPLNITGMPTSLEIGEKFTIVSSNEIKKLSAQSSKIKTTKTKKIYSVNDLIKNMMKDQKEKLNIIMKTDVQGSANVLKESIAKLSTDKIKINIIKIEIGNFNKSDIDLAGITQSLLIGFNVKCDIKTKKLAQSNNIKLNIFHIIYDLIDHITLIINDKIPKKVKENVIGSADVKKVFKQENSNVIAGCIITHGKIKKNANIRIIRKNSIIHEGTIESLKLFKESISEVKAGTECGISIKNYNNLQINDKIKVISLTN